MKIAKDTITYKGYIGSVRYSDEDGVFFGKIEGISDLVTFEGQSVPELKNTFHEAVDGYLEHCKEIGKNPDKPCRGSFNVRIKPELHRKIVMKASLMKLSLNRYIQTVLEKEVA